MTVDPDLVIKPEEWDRWRAEMHAVTLSPECLTIIRLIRQKLADQFETLQVYVSDRRWQRAALLMKASAYFNDRTTTNHSDAVLLQHCLWTQGDNRDAVATIVADAIRDTGFSSDVDFMKAIHQKSAIDKEIHNELFHTSDIYETVTLEDGKEYFEFKIKYRNGTIYNQYIQKEHIYKNSVPTLDEDLNQNDDFLLDFNNTATAKIKKSPYNHYSTPTFQDNSDTYVLPILFHKGDKKKDVSPRLKESLRNNVEDIRSRLEQALTQVRINAEGYETALTSPFITTPQRDLALTGINKQIESLEQHIADCQRLEQLCA
ncbi:hypothetical protein [Novispirillum itersonii]|uniref:hypothetical protein n=1 Tax=Novispirillum itersonii TaxID=189 RepID=UPI0003A839F0|nr:hypothetical protein [Novispirillum itersonii]